jgi:predicted RNA-binding Zn ribbon-like protein
VIFSHDTEVALEAAAALVNTQERAGDRLADLASLNRFVEEWAWTGSRRGDLAELEEVRGLRPRLRRLWQLDVDGVVAEVNAIMREAHALPQLVRHDGEDYHLHATNPEVPLADRMAVEAAMAFVDLVRLKQLHRLRLCGAEDCDDVLVDLSKNRSRLYCSATCSSRVNVAAFRARQR